MKSDQGFRADCRAAGDSHPGRAGFLDTTDGHFGPEYAYPADYPAEAGAAGHIQISDGRGDRADGAASLADTLNHLGLNHLVIPLYLLGIAGSATVAALIAWRGGF